MLIYFDSRTGNTQKFLEKVAYPADRIIPITDGLVASEPFILVTHTFLAGQVPEKTARFLEENGHLLHAVASGGDKIWAGNYGKAADMIARQYNVPVLMKFQKAGFPSEVDAFSRLLAAYVN